MAPPEALVQINGSPQSIDIAPLSCTEEGYRLESGGYISGVENLESGQQDSYSYYYPLIKDSSILGTLTPVAVSYYSVDSPKEPVEPTSYFTQHLSINNSGEVTLVLDQELFIPKGQYYQFSTIQSKEGKDIYCQEQTGNSLMQWPLYIKQKIELTEAKKLESPLGKKQEIDWVLAPNQNVKLPLDLKIIDMTFDAWKEDKRKIHLFYLNDKTEKRQQVDFIQTRPPPAATPPTTSKLLACNEYDYLSNPNNYPYVESLQDQGILEIRYDNYHRPYDYNTDFCRSMDNCIPYNVVVVDESFPTENINIYSRKAIPGSKRIHYMEATITGTNITVTEAMEADYLVEGWTSDSAIAQDCINNGIRVQKQIRDKQIIETFTLALPATHNLPEGTQLANVTYKKVDQGTYKIRGTYTNASKEEIEITLQATGTIPKEKSGWLEWLGNAWSGLWSVKTTYPETMPTLPPELTTAIDQVAADSWRPVRDTGLEWDDKWLLFDEDDIDQFDYKDKIVTGKRKDGDRSVIKYKVTGETTADTAIVTYTDAEGITHTVKVVKARTTSTHKSQENDSLIKTFVREVITVKENGKILYVDTKKTTTYPPSADGSVPEKIETERSFTDHTQEIETRQITGDDDKPYQFQYWLGTTDVSVGAGVMGGLSTLRFYDEEAPGHLIAGGAIVGVEGISSFHAFLSYDLALQMQHEGYASESGSTDLSVPWHLTARPYLTIGWASQNSSNDIKNNWSVGLAIPQTYQLKDFLWKTTSTEGQMTYGSTGYRVNSSGRWPWFAQGIGLRGRYYFGNKQQHSVMTFLTLDESFGSIYGNYDDLVIETSDGTITNPATATTAYGFGPVGAAYYTYSF